MFSSRRSASITLPCRLVRSAASLAAVDEPMGRTRAGTWTYERRASCSEHSEPIEERKRNMKIVVIGGTGLIGSKTAPILLQGGHEVVAASPNTGVNSITGEGLKE